jgi:hypothetical protein
MPTVPWTVEENWWGGESLFIPFGVDLDLIPSPHQELMTPQHREAFARPDSYFVSLAERAALPGMRRWLMTIAEAGAYELHVHHTFEFHGMSQVSLVVPRKGRRPASVQLASGRDTAHLPNPLNNLYQLIDGDRTGFAEAGGIESIDYRTNLEGMLKHPDDTPLTSRMALVFYKSGGGDLLIADDGRAIAWLHENLEVYVAGPLEEVVDSYFRCNATGEEWPYEPTYQRK